MREIVVNELKDLIKDKYNIEISDNSANKIVTKIFYLIEQDVIKNTDTNGRKDTFLRRKVVGYWKMSRLPNKELKRHSCFVFTRWLERYFYVIGIDKKSWLGKIITRLKNS